MGQQFRNRNWDERYLAMGDEAEQVFERVHPRGWSRFGIRRPEIQVGKLPLKIRYTPDYITSFHLVEVQGFGKDQLVKLKLEKERALHAWNDDMATQMFLWDRTNQRYGYIDIADLTHAAHTHGQLDWLDNKRAWFIPAAEMEMTWQSAKS